MFVSIFAWVYLWFAVPSPVVNWASQNHDSMEIQADGSEELLNRCIEGGIEVRYRYEMRYCTKGSFWFDQCEDSWVEIKSLQYDPVKETYLIQSDLLDDKETPEKGGFSTLAEAQKALSTIQHVNIEKIARGKLNKKTERDYIGIRVLSECRGSVGNTLLDISYYLTFGLVKVSRFDSGWVAFYINK
jgi:hypothetical protein